MTIEEIQAFLANTKVYVNGKSKGIQEKLFSFGYRWLGCKDYKIQFTESPFLFMSDNEEITYSDNMNFFKNQKYREITAEEILSLKLTEPTFKGNSQYLSPRWHEITDNFEKEEPSKGLWIISECERGYRTIVWGSLLHSTWKEYVMYHGVRKWAYVNDLLPKIE